MTLKGPWPGEEPTPEQSSEELGTAEEMEAHHTEQPPVLPSSTRETCNNRSGDQKKERAGLFFLSGYFYPSIIFTARTSTSLFTSNKAN